MISGARARPRSFAVATPLYAFLELGILAPVRTSRDCFICVASISCCPAFARTSMLGSLSLQFFSSSSVAHDHLQHVSYTILRPSRLFIHKLPSKWSLDLDTVVFVSSARKRPCARKGELTEAEGPRSSCWKGKRHRPVLENHRQHLALESLSSFASLLECSGLCMSLRQRPPVQSFLSHPSKPSTRAQLTAKKETAITTLRFSGLETSLMALRT